MWNCIGPKIMWKKMLVCVSLTPLNTGWCYAIGCARLRQDAILNMESYKCNICDTDVPKAFIDEHTKSVKHELNIKIMNIALQRMQAQVKSDPIQPRLTIEVTDTYFCGNCASMIKNMDKEEHIISEKHLNSVKNDKLLQVLVNIYEQPEVKAKDIQLKDFETNTDTNMKENIGKTDIKCNDGVKPVKETNKLRYKTNFNSHKNYCENLNESRRYFETASNYVSFDVRPYNHNTVIVRFDGKSLRIPLKNFHGYSVLGSKIVCNVCQDFESTDGIEHKWRGGHITKVSQPLKKGFFRHISKTLVHCLLCNTVLPTSEGDDHSCSKEHITYLKKYTIQDTVTENVARLAAINHMTLTDDSAFCTICKIDVPKTNESLNTHTQTSQHKVNNKKFKRNIK